ncbi:MAG: hypothetical protein HXK82_04845 [Lachnospiraceae bacterium]|nr:hypothetical protein [Lachnospiraceae bacterium]
MNCAEDKLDAAYENLPTEKKLVRKKQYLNQENTENPQNLTSKQQKPTFHVEEFDKKPKYRQKFHQPIERMTFSAENVLHGKIYEVEKENVGVEAGHKGERIAESAVRHTTRKIHSAYRQHHLKPYQEVEKA